MNSSSFIDTNGTNHFLSLFLGMAITREALQDLNIVRILHEYVLMYYWIYQMSWGENVSLVEHFISFLHQV